jgi:hypothetical protein
MTRSAISPRLAIRTFLNIGRLYVGPDPEQRLPYSTGCAVLDEDPRRRAGDIGLDLVHQLHRLDDAEHRTLVDLVVERHVRRRVRVGLAIERADERRRRRAPRPQVLAAARRRARVRRPELALPSSREPHHHRRLRDGPSS